MHAFFLFLFKLRLGVVLLLHMLFLSYKHCVARLVLASFTSLEIFRHFEWNWGGGERRHTSCEIQKADKSAFICPTDLKYPTNAGMGQILLRFATMVFLRGWLRKGWLSWQEQSAAPANYGASSRVCLGQRWHKNVRR